MRSFTQLPRSVLCLEVLGIVMLVLSYFMLHDMLPFAPPFSGKTAATIMIFIAILMMLPAAIVMMWRTGKALAPELFNARSSSRKKSGDSHDADH